MNGKTKPKRDPKTGTAQKRADLERRNAELQRENIELRGRLFAVHCYLRGFQLGFKEALRTSSLSEPQKTLAISLVRQADKTGKAHKDQPPSVMECLVPAFGDDLFREVA
jgi:hypothetical protein